MLPAVGLVAGVVGRLTVVQRKLACCGRVSSLSGWWATGPTATSARLAGRAERWQFSGPAVQTLCRSSNINTDHLAEKTPYTQTGEIWPYTPETCNTTAPIIDSFDVRSHHDINVETLLERR